MATAYSIGNTLMTIIQKSLGMQERGDVCPRLILTKRVREKVGWFNYLRQDNDFGNKKDTAKAIKLIQDSGDELACKYFLDDYFEVTGARNFCRATTCCWKLMEKDDEYTHRQFFVNTTCRVALNVSSNAFSEMLDQISCTFYGGLFEHCTSMPVWLSRDGMRVRIKPRGRNTTGPGANHIEMFTNNIKRLN